MGVLALLAVGLGFYPSYHQPGSTGTECTMGAPSLKMLYLPGGETGRIAVGGRPENLGKLLKGYPALISREGEEIPLQLVERATDQRDPSVAIYAPRTSLVPGRGYTLKSWFGSAVARRDPDLRDAPPVWNGSIVAVESARGVTLRFTPQVGPLVRVVSGDQRSLISVAGGEVELGCIGCTESLDLGDGRATVTVTVIDGWGRESIPRSFEVVQPKRMRGMGCRAPGITTTRLVSTPVVAPLEGWSLLQRLFVFVSLPFFLSYGAVTLAMGLVRRRRRRIIASL